MARFAHGPVATLTVLTALLAVLAGCSGGGAHHPDPSASDVTGVEPLPTKGVSNVDLLCGFVSRQSVEAALGRKDLTVSGRIEPAGTPNADGTKLASARCSVTIAQGGQAPAFSVMVEPFTPATGAGILRTARITPDYTGNVHYSNDVGIGFAAPDTYIDGEKKAHDSCNSGLVRGNWVITLGINVPGAGRNAVQDTMALAQEIVDELKLPLEPTKPYPNPN